jgi:O-antigen ligase
MSARELGTLMVVLAVLVLLPIGRTSELPLLIGGLVGIGWLLRGRFAPLHASRLHLTIVLFACYWIPALLSGFSAVMPHKTWMTVLEAMRFLPFALFVVWALRRPDAWPGFLLAVACICALWVLDAWVQFLSGYSLGGAPELERLTGIFGPENLKLGPVLAVLSPFFLDAARKRAGQPGLLLAFLAILIPILLAGSRAAWLSFGLVCVVFAWRETRSIRRFLPLLLGAGIVIAFSIGVMLRDSDRFDARIERSLLVFEGTERAIDEASAGRLRIWHAAAGMIRTHPLTGVGVRGFRYDYAEHAPSDDLFVDPDTGQGALHAHQIVLEVLAETGIIGLLFWIFGSVQVLRSWRRASIEQRQRAFVPALALVAMCFPLNTHLAFYSAWWGLFFWWLLAIFCAALAAAPEQADSNAADDRSGSDQHAP